MGWWAQVLRRGSRPRPFAARRVAAALLAVLFAALGFGIGRRVAEVAHSDLAGAVSSAGATVRVLPVGRTSGANPFFALVQPVTHRRFAFGGLFVDLAGMAAASLFSKQASLRSGRRLRFESIFPSRRGPPTLVAR